MAQGLKIDIINGAFAQLRISGLTVVPSPSQLTTALRRLESSLAELKDVWNIDISYNFEEEPNLNSPHNLKRGLWDAIEVYLGFRLAPDYNKQIPASYSTRLKGAVSALFKSSASIPKTRYPASMPKGKGNRTSPFDNFFPSVTPVSSNSGVITMYNGTSNVLTESFIEELLDAEVISSYTIETDDELTVSGDSNTNSAITMTVTATGVSDGSASLPSMKITIVTDTPRTLIRIINFELLSSEI